MQVYNPNMGYRDMYHDLAPPDDAFIFHDAGNTAQVYERPNPTKRSCCYIVLKIIYFLLVMFFYVLCIYSLVTANSETEVCGRDLWNLLLMHLVMPFIAVSFFLMVALLVYPFLLSCTHRNPFCLFFVPLLLLFAYNCTMLVLGIKFLTDTKQECSDALTKASKDISPSAPLLIVLSWVYVAIDALSLLTEIISLLFLICVQINFKESPETSSRILSWVTEQ